MLWLQLIAIAVTEEPATATVTGVAAEAGLANARAAITRRTGKIRGILGVAHAGRLRRVRVRRRHNTAQPTARPPSHGGVWLGAGADIAPKGLAMARARRRAAAVALAVACALLAPAPPPTPRRGPTTGAPPRSSPTPFWSGSRSRRLAPLGWQSLPRVSAAIAAAARRARALQSATDRLPRSLVPPPFAPRRKGSPSTLMPG